MLFIIKGQVKVHHYMSDSKPEPEDFIYPVEATDEADARDILEKHYSQNDSPYSHWHSVEIHEVFPTLSRKA